eukprot:1179835-Prorocentrum_minimum.AAC.3
MVETLSVQALDHEPYAIFSLPLLTLGTPGWVAKPHACEQTVKRDVLPTSRFGILCATWGSRGFILEEDLRCEHHKKTTYKDTNTTTTWLNLFHERMDTP